MPRVKSNPVRLRRKKQVMKAAKGYYGARSKLWGPAKESVERAWRYAYRDRKNKKREFRRLWVIRINAGAHLNGMNYSTFINGLMKAGIEIDRKILSDIAIQDPAAFTALADKARAALTAAYSATAAHTGRRPTRLPAVLVSCAGAGNCELLWRGLRG